MLIGQDGAYFRRVSVGMFDLFRRLDDAVLPDRWSSHPLERSPSRWERWVATHTWKAAALGAVIAGVSISTAWTLTGDSPFDLNDFLNDFVVGAAIAGGIAFAVFAWLATNMAASVRVRDRLRDRNDTDQGR